jgi:hypothetical protein
MCRNWKRTRELFLKDKFKPLVKSRLRAALSKVEERKITLGFLVPGLPILKKGHDLPDDCRISRARP